MCGANGGKCKHTDVEPEQIRLNHLKHECGEKLAALAAVAGVNLSEAGVERDRSFARRADAAVARFRADLNTAG